MAFPPLKSLFYVAAMASVQPDDHGDNIILPPDVEDSEDEFMPALEDFNDMPSVVGSVSDVGLPDDVAEVVEESDSDSEDEGIKWVELPPNVSPFCKCCRGCGNNIPESVVKAMRDHFVEIQDPMDRNNAKIDAVRAQLDTHHKKDGKFYGWNINGTQVCLPFWQHAHLIGPGKMKIIRDVLDHGGSAYPEPAARISAGASDDPWLKVDAWLHELYLHDAEYLADTNNDADDIMDRNVTLTDNLDEFDIIEMSDHPLWTISVLLPDPTNPGRTAQYCRKKHLDPCTVEDIFNWYHTDVDDPQGRSTFMRCWSERWSRFIKIRNHGQGKRCRFCATKTEERRRATTREEKARIDEELRLHRDDNKADRNASVRTNHMAEQHAKRYNEHDGQDLCGECTIDGMDQAKFKCPRNMASNADFDPLWRPQLHLVGAIWHGVVEAYYIMGPDVPKDSNMASTVFARTIDVGREMLPPGTKLPHSFIISTDNTAREAKNQHHAQTCAWYVATKKFESMAQGFLKTGHSHNHLDQRFSTISTALKAAPVLESPEEFRDWIQQNVKPLRGRQLHVEVLDTIMDFQAWQVPMEVHMGGLAACASGRDTNHSWRFVPRKVLGTIGGFDDDVVENSNPEWDALAPDENDVVMLVKESLGSTTFSQKPLLVLPASVALHCKPSDIKPAVRSAMSDRELKEYAKTAVALSKAPWDMFKSQQYLTTLVDDNKNNVPLPSLELQLLNYEMTEVAPVPATFGTDTTRQPRTVAARKATPAELRRRQQKFANVKKILKRPAASTKAAAMKKPAAAVAACPLAECRELGIDPADMPVTDDDELEALLQAAADAVPPPPGAEAECLELGLDPAEMPVTDDDELEALLQAAADAVPPPPVADVAVPPPAALPAAADDAAAPPPAFPYVDLVRVLEAADPGAVAAAAAAAVIPPPVPAPASPRARRTGPRSQEVGCKKCRGLRGGCGICKKWAATGNKGFRMSGAVVLSGDTYW